MAIRGFLDMDIHIIYFVGYMDRTSHFFVWLDEYLLIGRAIFLFGWMDIFGLDRESKCDQHL
jgi:hypothetical protein